MTDQKKDDTAFDVFELAAAIMLGLGAIGASIAGYQEGLWGGASIEGYGEAAALTTKAATTYNDELTTYMQDVQADSRIKELIWEGNEEEDDASGSRKLGIANWMIFTRLSEHAYLQLGLPAETREKYFAALGDDAQNVTLTEDEFSFALANDLNDTYIENVFSTSGDEFEAADKRFATGSTANENGDSFSLAGVIFTVALFFAGVSLVFRTRLRWGILGAGTVVFFGGLIYMIGLTWA